MITALMIFGAALVVFLMADSIRDKHRKNLPAPLPSERKMPTELSENDKLVLITEADDDKLKQAITDFCDMYNKESFKALPRLIKIADKEFAVTFPYDIEFEFFCIFINYLYYPIDIQLQAIVTGWTTKSEIDNWVREDAMNKRVMLFIPEDDKEYDNVYMTTEDCIGYKLGFAVGYAAQPLASPKKDFSEPAIDLTVLNDKPFEDFQ